MRRKDSTVRGRYDLWLWLLEMRWPLQGLVVTGKRAGDEQGPSGELEYAIGLDEPCGQGPAAASATYQAPGTTVCAAHQE